VTSCAECGYDWAGSHGQTVSTVGALPRKLARLIQERNVVDADIRLRARPASTVWSPLEYMAHIADAISWYSTRVDLALSEAGAAFSGFDWDAHTDAQRYHERQLDVVLQDVDRQCRRFATTLTGLAVTDWQWEGIGSDGQPRTIAALAHRAAHEAQHHLHDIALRLGGTNDDRTAPARPKPPGSAKRSLLVSDLDGTLLRSDGTLGPRTIEVINAFIARGGLFTYATARSFTTASVLTQGLALTIPVITYGGAVLVDPATGDARPAKMIGAATARAVIGLTEHSPTLQPIMFATHGSRDRVCWLAHRQSAGVEGFLAKRQGDPRLLPLPDWSEVDLDSVFYISIIGRHDALAELHTRIPTADVHVMFSQDVYTPAHWWIEISASHGTKAAALAGLARELEVDELICFGDNHNDLPMFAIADQAIAVSNAVPEALAAAAHVIGSNDDEGVAEWVAGLLARPVRASDDDHDADVLLT